MAFFFFVVGLEARREFDMGELRERRRITLPVLAGIGGMTMPVLIYLAFNLGGAGAHGWGAAMSTDTAFALGMLALVGPALSRAPARLHADRRRGRRRRRAARDRRRLHRQRVGARRWSMAHRHLRAAARPCARSGSRTGSSTSCSASPAGSRCYESGIQPEIIGLAMGLVTGAYAATRVDLERATQLVRLVPRAAHARARARGAPRRGLRDLAERARADAAAPVDELRRRADLRARERGRRDRPSTCSSARSARRSPSASSSRTSSASPSASSARRGSPRAPSRGELRPPVGWPALARRRRARGHRLHRLAADREPGVPRARRSRRRSSACSPRRSAPRSSAGSCSASSSCIPRRMRARQLAQTTETIVDLAVPVDPEIDHVRGPATRPSRSSSTPTSSARTAARPSRRCATCSPSSATTCATSTATCRCPTCTRAPQIAAEAAEAAGKQGRFWEMHDLLFAHQDALRPPDLVELRGRARPRHGDASSARSAATSTPRASRATSRAPS